MEIRSSNGFIESLLAQKLLANQARPQTRQNNQDEQRPNTPQDIVTLGNSAPNFDPNFRGGQLVRETQESTENGIRVTQQFERQDGRSFTRIQDFAVTDRGFRRDVIQQNASGSITRLEEVLDRQDNGLFRRTQRFSDVSGQTQTRIDNDFVSRDPFVLSNGQNAGNANENNPFDLVRGTRLNIEA